MRALKRWLRPVLNFVERCSDAIWLRHHGRYSWAECWQRAGWWQ